MKIKFIALSALIASGISANANANLMFDIYTGVTVGVGALSVYNNGKAKTNSDQSFGAIIGADIPLARFELEYNYINETDINMQIAAFNAYLKMPTTLVQPYIGAGFGMIFEGDIDNGINPYAKFDDSTVYQGMLGLTFSVPVLPIKADAEARAMYMPYFYTWTSATNHDKPDALHYELRLKLRYVF